MGKTGNDPVRKPCVERALRLLYMDRYGDTLPYYIFRNSSMLPSAKIKITRMFFSKRGKTAFVFS